MTSDHVRTDLPSHRSLLDDELPTTQLPDMLTMADSHDHDGHQRHPRWHRRHSRPVHHAIRERAVRQPGGLKKNDGIAIEIHELDRKNPFYDRDLIPDSENLPPPFDFERLTRFMAYGFCMAPVQFKWFRFLERIFPITKTSAFGPAMKRVAFDQLIFAPFGLGVFFTTMTIAEGGGRRAISNKLRDMYIPTLKANYCVWPAVQIVNFRLMPVQYQLPFVSTIGIAWTAYLSLTNSSSD
ncbi:hypothetical protein NM208_g16735 [Fusarium decemcellulare]|uniref:Uncharacterized protein n=1 Tax=Fusarium decemcellulare TaxID=57161 RepID=A0ACC1R9D1_9HYPO|nr:hypothetical protein NM208_g16735 [Fusarium decemcellulare]